MSCAPVIAGWALKTVVSAYARLFECFEERARGIGTGKFVGYF